MNEQTKREIIQYCERNQDVDFETVAALFNVSVEEARSAYFESLF